MLFLLLKVIVNNEWQCTTCASTLDGESVALAYDKIIIMQCSEMQGYLETKSNIQSNRKEKIAYSGNIFRSSKYNES